MKVFLLEDLKVNLQDGNYNIQEIPRNVLKQLEVLTLVHNLALMCIN